MESPKRRPGRPKKMPDGEHFTIRCVLVNGEKERFDEARKMVKESQSDFTRQAVLERVELVLAKKKKTVSRILLEFRNRNGEHQRYNSLRLCRARG